MSELDIRHTWLAQKGAQTPLEATLADVTMIVGSRNVTAFKAEDEEASEFIRLPVYALAEWVAENWWALLWEPRKSDDGEEDDNGFVGRHSLLAAQRGFALPQVSFVSNGPYVAVAAQSRFLPHSEVKFINRAFATLNRSDVEEQLRRFVQSTCDQLEKADVRETHLQLCWNAVRETDPDEVAYCQMMGALGLSPYGETASIDAILDEFCEHLGEGLTLDLCLVGRPEEIKKAARAAKVAVSVANSTSEIDIGVLSDVVVPKDQRMAPSWHVGKRAATLVREKFGFGETDADAASKIFDRLQLDPSKKASIGNSDFQPEGAAIVGAVLRQEKTAKISFIQRHEHQRRFAAARGLFSAWTLSANGAHLLTQAVTRHQQASRAFAAELLAPFAYIRARAVQGVLRSDDIDEIAATLRVGADVVAKQAVNNGLRVSKLSY